MTTKRGRRLAGVVAGATLMLMSAGQAATAAQDKAVESVPGCESFKVCTYLVGRLLDVFDPVKPGQCRYAISPYNEMSNRSGYYQRVWTESNCTGYNTLIGPLEDWSAQGLYRSIGGY